MPMRTICIQNPANLSVRNNSLAIEGSGTLCGLIPLEDIWVVIIESHEVRITTAAASKLVDSGIGVMFCGNNHMPNGLLLPLGAHSRHAAIVENQLAMTKPLQKRLWKRIIKAKIENQATTLDLLGFDGTSLRNLSKDVRSGDTTNRESAAASIYFSALTPDGGRRGSRQTSALDYGYAVLRAGIARAAVSGGWLVSRGIHHCNNLNAFNLVDDLIEPFRPIVDLLVFQEEISDELDSRSKHKLASVFEYEVDTPLGIASVQSAITAELDTLKAAVKADDSALLLLPSIVPLHKCDLE